MGFTYEGRSLPSLFDRRLVTRLGEDFARDVQDALLDKVVENTPLDTGNLRTSWYPMPIVKFYAQGTPAYQGGVATDVEYAPFAEEGSGLYGPEGRKYLIEAKPGKWLSWVAPKTIMTRGKDGQFKALIRAGERVYVKRVWHPGSPGAHMVAFAVGYVESSLERVTARSMREWVRNVERGR